MKIKLFVMGLLVVLLISGGLLSQGPTPDQLRVKVPQDNNLRLLGFMKRSDGTVTFVTVRAGAGLWSVTPLVDPPYAGEVSVDYGAIAYRASPPTGPGPCVMEGAGAFATKGTDFYICIADPGGQTFSWTQFSGGKKTW